MEFIQKEKLQTLEGGVTSTFPKQKSSLYDEYEAITSEDCVGSFKSDQITIQRADVRVDPASLEIFDGKTLRDAHLVGTPGPEKRVGFMGVPLFTKTEIDVMETTFYHGTLGNSFQGRLVQNAAFFVLKGVAAVLDAKFVQIHVHGPFVSCHCSPESKRVSETHYLSNKTVATVLVGSILHLPKSLNASIGGRPMLDGAVVIPEMDGCDIHFLVSGLGGRRKKKMQLVGNGDYTSEVVRAVAKAALEKTAGVALGLAGKAAYEGAKYAEKATRKKRVAAGKKIAGFVKAKMSYLGTRMNRLIGRGDYTIAGNQTVVNSLMKGSNMSAQQSFGGECACIVVEHREFIGDIATGVSTSTPSTFPFNIGIIEVNPGLSASFPWLAQIAENYEEYCCLGLVYEFVSTTSPYNSNSAMGELIFTSQDNPTAPVYTTRSQLFNSEMSTAARLDKNMMYGIECKNPAVPWYQVRKGTSSTPINLTDPVKFYYSTSVASTFPQNSTIGELWVTYRIAFRGPILTAATGGTIVGNFNTTELGTSSKPGFFGSLNGLYGVVKGYGRFAPLATIQQTFNILGATGPTSSALGLIRLPAAVIGEIYRVSFVWTVSLNTSSTLPTTATYLPVMTLVGMNYYVPDINTGLLTTPSNTTTIPTSNSSLSLRTYVQSFYVQITKPIGNSITMNWPTIGGVSVNSGVFPVTNASSGGTFGGNSSVVADITYLGTQFVATLGSFVQSNQVAPFWQSLPLFGDSLGIPTSIGQFEPPTLLP